MMTRAFAYALTLLLALPLRADPMLIDRFDDGRADGWRFFSDQVMGGVSEGRATVEDGALVLRGDVSTANNGGFIQVRLQDVDLPVDTQALVLRTRGDGQDYFIHIRTSATRLPWHYYQARFTAPRDWAEVRLPLDAFAPSHGILPDRLTAEAVRSVALVAYGRDHRADVRLSEIRAE
jgi:hypothetical protein